MKSNWSKMHRFIDIDIKKANVKSNKLFRVQHKSKQKLKNVKPLVKWQILWDINTSYCRVYQTLLQNWCKITTDFLYTSHNNTVRSIPALLSIYHLYVHVAKYIWRIYICLMKDATVKLKTHSAPRHIVQSYTSLTR